MKKCNSILTFIALILIPHTSCLIPSVHASAKASYLHFVNGLLLERKGNYGEALQEYRSTIALDPQSAYVYRHALNLALHIGRTDDAMEWAHHLVATDTGNAENWVLLGNVQWAKGKTDEARESFEKALDLNRDNQEALYQIASLLSSGQPEKSINYLQRYLQTAPEQAAEVYYQMSMLYNLLGKQEEVVRNLNLAIKKDPDYLQARYGLAQFYEARGDTSTALGQYLDILPKDSRNTALLNHIGEIYANSGKLGEAESYFLQARETDPANPTAGIWLAVLSEQKEDFQAAVNYLKESRQADKDPSMCMRLGYYLTQSGRYREAVAEMEEGYKRWPENAEIAYFLALGLDDLHQTARALEILKKTLEARPDYREARLQYAVISERSGSFEEAEKSFRELVKTRPEDSMVLNYLGYSLADRGLKLDEAESFIKKAVELDPKNGAYLDSLGWVHFRQGRHVEALGELKRAVSMVGEDETVWEHLGDAYSVTGRTRQAWYCWKVSGSIKPGRRALDERITESEKKMPDAELASLLMEYLRTVQDGIREFSAFCKLAGKIGGKELKFDGMITFKSPDSLTLDIMGPMLVPMWRANLSGRQFDMDEMPLEGIKQDDLYSAAQLVLESSRRYFSGELFFIPRTGLDYSRSKRRIRTERNSIFLDKDAAAVSSFQLADVSRFQVRLDGNKNFKGRLIPSIFEFKSPFVSLKLTIDKWTGKFQPERIPLPE
ncbi:MAG: tetratricopeptide repeat protein [bacterium]